MNHEGAHLVIQLARQHAVVSHSLLMFGEKLIQLESQVRVYIQVSVYIYKTGWY